MDPNNLNGQKQNNNEVSPTTYPEFDFTNVGNSGMDCTGSVPRPPESDAELDSYLDIYNFLPKSIATMANGEETKDTTQ